MRRHIGRHQAHFGIEEFGSFPGHAQVAEMDRVEGATGMASGRCKLACTEQFRTTFRHGNGRDQALDLAPDVAIGASFGDAVDSADLDNAALPVRGVAERSTSSETP